MKEIRTNEERLEDYEVAVVALRAVLDQREAKGEGTIRISLVRAFLRFAETPAEIAERDE